MGQLHVVFLPIMAHGHVIPMLDMAKLFHWRGVRTTFISTPAFANPIKNARESGIDIGLTMIKFPPHGSDLPENVVGFDQIMAQEDMFSKFTKALAMLQVQVEEILGESRPNCLVADMFLPWSTDAAAKFGIPRLVFHGISTFALCAVEQMKRLKPYNTVSSDSEPFLLPNLPHRIELLRSQVSKFDLDETETDFSLLRQQMRDSETNSRGVIINSFYELESDYVDHYKKDLGRRAWSIGPLFLHNKVNRVDDQHECIAWLDSKKPDSVVYVCFGTMASFTLAQLRETALGLEASGQDFIWVVRNGNKEEGWLPEGYEERVEGRGLIVRGWAPQVMILDHPSVGAFVTHCGWNSTLEGVCAGLPMVTWPVFAEQFFNEKLVTKVLRTGVSVGNKQWMRRASEGVSREAVAKAVQRVITGDEATDMRRRAKEYQKLAREAVEDGGSSYNELTCLLEELSANRPSAHT